MGAIKGSGAYAKWQRGEKLWRSEAILAHCYQCNGMNEGGVDCQGYKTCPLYEYFHYKGVKKKD